MNANPIGALPDVSGCYFLNTRGGLGECSRDGRFTPDEKLSHGLSGLIAAFIGQYVQIRDTRGWRMAHVHADHQDQPWASATLSFEDYVLRDLYPVRGVGLDQLTAFQRRNRDKSFYRGMDLILSQEEQLGGSLPLYCPVLLYRGLKLQQVLPGIGREPLAADRDTPVFEVINLLAGASLADRCNPAVATLNQRLRRNLIKPEKRSIPNLVVIDDVRDMGTASFTVEQKASSL